VAYAGPSNLLMCQSLHGTYVAWSTSSAGHALHVDLARGTSAVDISVDCPRYDERYDVQKCVQLNSCLLLICIFGYV
jgi:hypothetical protein